MKYETFADVLNNDSHVRRVMESGGNPKDVIIALANEKELLIQKVVELTLIAPKRITTPKGVMVWHCPDHLIPQDDASHLSTLTSDAAQP